MVNQSLANATSRMNDKHFSFVLTIIFLNTTSVMINVAHIKILSGLPKVRKLKFFWILVYLGLVDILYSFSHIINDVLFDLTAGTLQVNFEVAVVIKSLKENVIFFRYWQILLACVDRYYAVCKPFQYETSKIVRNIGKLSFLVLVTVIALGTTIKLLSSVIWVNKSMEDLESSHNIVTGVVAFLTMATVICTTILLVKITRELRKMMVRGNLKEEDHLVINACRYVRGTSVLFYSTLSTALVGIPVILLIKDERTTDHYLYINNYVKDILQSLYGIANVGLYAYVNRGYMQIVQSRIRALSSARVSSN